MILTRLERELHRALKSLKQGQLRVARNNGRTRVRRVLRRIEAMLDREYPVVPKDAVKRRGPLTKQGWEARMRARKWVQSGYGTQIPIAWIEARVPMVKGKDGWVWVPWWARAAGPAKEADIQKLRELKRSAKARAALFTTKALVP